MWKTYPHGRTAKLGLGIGGPTIRAFNLMIRQEAKGITCLACLHRGGARCDFGEYGPVFVFVLNMTTFKDNTAFKLPVRVRFRKFGVLFNTNVCKSVVS